MRSLITCRIRDILNDLSEHYTRKAESIELTGAAPCDWRSRSRLLCPIRHSRDLQGPCGATVSHQSSVLPEMHMMILIISMNNLESGGVLQKDANVPLDN